MSGALCLLCSTLALSGHGNLTSLRVRGKAGDHIDILEGLGAAEGKDERPPFTRRAHSDKECRDVGLLNNPLSSCCTSRWLKRSDHGSEGTRSFLCLQAGRHAILLQGACLVCK